MEQAKRHGRILVVDDEANARLALNDLLKEEGHKVETAADDVLPIQVDPEGVRAYMSLLDQLRDINSVEKQLIPAFAELEAMANRRRDRT